MCRKIRCDGETEKICNFSFRTKQGPNVSTAMLVVSSCSLVEYQVTSGTLAVPVFVAIIIAILHKNDWEFGVSVPISNLNSDFTPPFLTL